MDLKSGYPFWAIRNGLPYRFPQLRADLRCGVLVVGGGISGALIADELAAHGHAVALVERRDIGWGSSAASTALLQYEIDTHMTDLAKRHGEAAAVLAYRACAEAIPMLADKAAQVRDVDFTPRHSLYYASTRRHRKPLREEYELRRKHGFDVQWLESAAIGDEYGFDAPAAILSRLAAGVDPYRMAWRLLWQWHRRGMPVFDRTEVTLERITSRQVLLRTPRGHAIQARHVVVACGYESQHWLQSRMARNRSSYAFITDPIPREQLGPLRTTMLWESARPYLYLRVTGEDRLLIGGEDDAVDIPARRDARVAGKARTLSKKLSALFPRLPVEPAFSWAGTFAETDDGLPYFGAHPQHGPRVLFAMAYGGNGITYSMLGAGLLRAIIERRAHPLQRLFGFSRPR